MSQAGADLEAVMFEYAAAVRAKDPARVAALYAPGVRVFDAWDVWSYDDRAACGHSLDAWLGSLGNEGVQVVFEEIRP
jgi:ketosteroid isomerase-like protein